ENPGELSKATPEMQRALLGLEQDTGGTSNRVPAVMSGPLAAREPSLSGRREGPDGAIIPDEGVFNYETRPDAGDDARQLAREAISDLRQTGVNRSARAFAERAVGPAESRQRLSPSGGRHGSEPKESSGFREALARDIISDSRQIGPG